MIISLRRVTLKNAAWVAVAVVAGWVGSALRPEPSLVSPSFVESNSIFPQSLTMPLGANGPYDLEHFNMTYQRTAGEMADPALVMRGNAYFFESSEPLWMATLTKDGLSVGIDANDPDPVTRARLHVRNGRIRIDVDDSGAEYAELFVKPDGLWVMFPSGKAVMLARSE